MGGSASSGAADTEVATTSISGTAGEGTGGSTTSTTAGAESTGTTTGDVSSTDTSVDSTSGPQESWHRYSLDTVAGTWSVVSLDALWTGANAPPSTGIAAAVSLTHFDRLFVLTEDGVVHEQADGVWQSPEPIARRFPMAAGIDVSSIVHVPGQAADDNEEIFFIATPTAVIYRQFENGGLELVEVVEQQDEDGGAPQGTVANDWGLTISDPTGIGSDADWLVWYRAFANGEMWRFNAAAQWMVFPLEDNPFFGVAAGEPDPLQVRAAYYDDAFERAHFIAP